MSQNLTRISTGIQLQPTTAVLSNDGEQKYDSSISGFIVQQSGATGQLVVSSTTGSSPTFPGLTINGNESITGTLGVSGAATINNNVTVTGALSVSGAATLAGAVTVNNNETITGTLSVSGAANHSSYLNLAEISTPSNPSSGFIKIYPKSDNNLYTLNSSGVETALTGGGGGGGGLTPIAITGNTTLVKGNMYIVASTSLVTLTLPSTSSVGDEIGIVGVGSGGWKIQSNASATAQTINEGSYSSLTSSSNAIDLILSSSQNDSLTIRCVTTNSVWNATSLVGTNVGVITSFTGGDSVNTSGNYKIVTFNNSGTFQVLAGKATVEYLIVGGGGAGGEGGGGAGHGGGGGGAGGVIYNTPGSVLGVGTYTVTVGSGGVGALGSGGAGGNSAFNGFTAVGGGGGGDGGVSANPGNSGGSGGGGGAFGNGAGGSGTVGQGNNGAAGVDPLGGGGGGANTAGSGGNGGNGVSNSITGSAVVYGGGGGGGSSGTGGSGGGGNGGAPGAAGTNGLGGGGGGSLGGGVAGANGGKGVVILKFRFQ